MQKKPRVFLHFFKWYREKKLLHSLQKVSMQTSVNIVLKTYISALFIKQRILSCASCIKLKIWPQLQINNENNIRKFQEKMDIKRFISETLLSHYMYVSI